MHKTSKWLALAAMMFAAAEPALAVGLTVRSGPNPLLDTPGQLEILQQRQDRRDYQNQQQQFREQDRQVVPLQQPQRLRVPRMRSGCPIDINGNPAIGGSGC